MIIGRQQKEAFTLNDERRRRLSYRLEKLRDAFPCVEQLKQSAQETSTRARKMGDNLGKLAQQTREMLATVQQKVASLDK